MWKCPRCETLNEEETCIICAEPKPVEPPVAETPPQYTPPHEAPPEKPSGKKKTALLICILAVVALIIGVCLAAISMNSDDDTGSSSKKRNKNKHTEEPTVTSSSTPSPTKPSAIATEKAVKTEKIVRATPEPVSDRELIKETIDSYAAYAATLDIAGAKDCVKEGTELYEGMEEYGDYDMTDVFVMSMQESAGLDDDTAEYLAEILSPAMEDLLDKLKDSINIVYNTITIDADDNATVYATLQMPNTSDIFSTDFNSSFEEKLMGKITADMSENEMMDAMVEAFEEAVSELDFSQLEINETAATIKLEKVNGEWLITSDE